MNGLELHLSNKAIIQILCCLIYVPICLTVYWRLFPKLTRDAKRLANAFLAAQIIVIVLFLENQPKSEFEKWLFHPDLEWNIPSVLSSTQLALVGFIGLLTAFLFRTKHVWRRFHLLALGLFILFAGLEEYFSWKSSIPDWKEKYALVGSALAIWTIAAAVFSPRRERILFICLLTGLALIATGAFLIDQVPRPCGGFGPFRFNGCIRLYVIEEVLEFLGSWLALVAMLCQFSTAVPAPGSRLRLSLYILPALWILFVSYFSPSHNIEVEHPDHPAMADFESGIRMYGYSEDQDGLPTSIVLRLPDNGNMSGIGYSTHILDQASGISIVSSTDYVDRKEIVWPKRRGYVPLYRQAIDLEMPAQAPANRAFSVVLTLWREENGQYIRQKIVASDHQAIDETQLMLGELVLPATATASQTVPLARFDNGFALDAVDLPQRARPGDTLSVSFTWRSDAAGEQDHVQFLHLGHVESGEWFVYDRQPLGPRLPTRLWYSGLADSETWQVALPADLAPGRYIVFTGLYRLRDQERIPTADAAGTAFVDARVPLGGLLIEG